MFRNSVATRVVIPTVLGLLITAAASQAQPGHPQGMGRIGGAGSGNSGGSYSAPAYSGATSTSPTGSSASYQSYFPPEPERSGWQARSDGWYYYWSQNQLIGAYDPDGGYWYAHSAPTGWGNASVPPWKRK